MEFLINCGLFLLGLIVGTYIFRLVVFPITYGLPKSLLWVFQRKLKLWTPLLFLAFPLICILGLIFVIFFLDLFEVMGGSFAYGMGLHLTVGFLFLRSVISRSERAKMADVFANVVSEYRIDIQKIFE